MIGSQYFPFAQSGPNLFNNFNCLIPGEIRVWG